MTSRIYGSQISTGMHRSTMPYRILVPKHQMANWCMLNSKSHQVTMNDTLMSLAATLHAHWQSLEEEVKPWIKW